MRLYSSDASNFAARCRIVIGEKGLREIEIVPPPGDGPASPEYRRINPLGKIPALDIGGRVLVESEVINEYLEDRFPEPALLPKDPAARAAVRFVSRFHDLYLEPPLRALYPQAEPAARDPRLVAEKLPEVAARLDQLESILGEPWAAGESFTLADCAHAPTMLFARLRLPLLGAPSPFAGRPRLAAWWERVRGRPSVGKVLAEQRAALAQTVAPGPRAA